MATRELGIILYRCRRCGSLDRTMSSPDVTQTLISVIHGTPDPNASGIIRAALMSIHSCSDGGLGVTDIAGAELNDWQPPAEKKLPPMPPWPLR